MTKRIVYTTACLLLIVVITIKCRQVYEPAIIKANKNFLVVEGSINAGAQAVTTILLSRTRNVTDSVYTTPEPGASVSILSNTGTTYQLHEQGNGKYISDELNLNTDAQYQLQIITADNNKYVSALASVKQTPAIDSIHWTYAPGDGVAIFVSTHDPQNSTRYYRWEYTETWAYHPYFETIYGLKDTLIFIRDATNQVDTCWQTASSNRILIGSTANLSQDLIINDSIAIVPQNSIKIGDRYSILVKQYALSEESYQYWQLLQKNTQELGSIFDAQPSQLTGNIQCITNPAEPVIGYISASTVAEKRIFIKNLQVPGWQRVFSPSSDCQMKTIPIPPDNYTIFNYSDTSFAPYYFVMGGLVIAKKFCLDCRLAGGTTNRPDFW